MPELPEVEIVRQSLSKKIIRKTIKKVIKLIKNHPIIIILIMFKQIFDRDLNWMTDYRHKNKTKIAWSQLSTYLLLA